MEQQTGIFHEFTRKEKDINEEFILNVPVYLCKEEKREIVTLADIHSCIETMFQVLLLNKNEYFTVLAGDYGHRSNMKKLKKETVKGAFIEPELLNIDKGNYYLEEDLTSPNSILLAFCFLAFNKESIIPLRGNHETKDLLEVDEKQAAYEKENTLFLDKKKGLMSIENIFNSFPAAAMIEKNEEYAFFTHSCSPDKGLLESCFQNIKEKNGLFVIDKLKDFFKEVQKDYPSEYFNYLKNNNSGQGRLTVSLLCDCSKQSGNLYYYEGRIYLPEDLHMKNIHPNDNSKKVFCFSGHDNSFLSIFKTYINEKNEIKTIFRGDKRCCYHIPVQDTNNHLGGGYNSETKINKEFLTMNFAYAGKNISGQKVSPFIFPEDIFDKKDLNEELLKIKSILLSSEK